MSRSALGNSLLLSLLAAAAVALGYWQREPWWQGAPDTSRLLLAGALLVAFALLCFFCLRSRDTFSGDGQGILLLWASQTGFAMQLAEQGAAALKQAGVSAHALPLEAASADMLRQHRRVLLLASTTGEGDCPEHAMPFLPSLKGQALAGVEYAVLALGDSRYQAFCAYGKQLDAAMCEAGAAALFPRIEVDAGNPKALEAWQNQLSELAGGAALATPAFAEPQPWRLMARQCLNPGGVADSAWEITLTGENMDWQAGDVAVITPCNAPQRVREWLLETRLDGETRIDRHGTLISLQDLLAYARLPAAESIAGKTAAEIAAQIVPLPVREYSIASIPAEGSLKLLVRQMRDAQGELGLGSGWLTAHAPLGSEIWLRLRSNPAFHDTLPDAPMILIGSGTGIAGLRAHLAARAARGMRGNWLLFGERQAAHDFHFEADLNRWQREGIIEHLDTAFSRDSAERRYVQHVLAGQAARLREWVAQGAVIYVCGSLARMAPEVDAVIRQTLGDALHARLLAEGRYRREVY